MQLLAIHNRWLLRPQLSLAMWVVCCVRAAVCVLLCKGHQLVINYQSRKIKKSSRKEAMALGAFAEFAIHTIADPPTSFFLPSTPPAISEHFTLWGCCFCWRCSRTLHRHWTWSSFEGPSKWKTSEQANHLLHIQYCEYVPSSVETLDRTRTSLIKSVEGSLGHMEVK